MKLKKLIISTLAAACAVTSVMGFASCDMLMGEPAHKHDLTLVKGLEATCTKAGVKDYYTCSGCDDLFADAEGQVVIDAPERISASGHQEEIVPAKPATCLESGTTESKKCGKCGKVLVQGEAVLHDWITVGGTHYCADTLGDFNVANVSLTYENGEFNLVGNGGTVGAITAENAVLNLSGNLTVTSEETAISILKSTLNFAGGNVTVNGNVASDEAWIAVEQGAVATVNGTATIIGASEANADLDYGFKHRLIVEGTLNVNSNNEAALKLNSIRVGNKAKKSNGYLNVNSGTADGIIMASDAGSTRDEGTPALFAFAYGEANFVGSVTDGTATNDAISLGGNVAYKYIDVEYTMKLTVKNYRTAITCEYRRLYVGFNKDSIVLDNTKYYFCDELSTAMYVYPYVIIQAEYTDAEGKTGLANIKLAAGSYNFTKTTKADLSFIDFPTVEDFDGTNGIFMSWVEAE